MAEKVLSKEETAVLAFLQQTPGIHFTTEEVGRAVRPLVMQNPGGDVLIQRNWAAYHLRKLRLKHLVKKEGTGARGIQSKWWVPSQ